MNEGPNSPNKDRGYYHLCGEAAETCQPSKKYPTLIHSDKYRVLGQDKLTSKRVSWLKDKAIREGYEFCFKKFLGVMGSGAKSAGRLVPSR